MSSNTDERCRACGQMDDLDDRVAELRAWARSRLATCARAESSYPVGSVTEIEATQERRTLRAVLRILDGGTP